MRCAAPICWSKYTTITVAVSKHCKIWKQLLKITCICNTCVCDVEYPESWAQWMQDLNKLNFNFMILNFVSYFLSFTYTDKTWDKSHFECDCKPNIKCISLKVPCWWCWGRLDLQVMWRLLQRMYQMFRIIVNDLNFTCLTSTRTSFGLFPPLFPFPVGKQFRILWRRSFHQGMPLEQPTEWFTPKSSWKDFNFKSF